MFDAASRRAARIKALTYVSAASGKSSQQQRVVLVGKRGATSAASYARKPKLRRPHRRVRSCGHHSRRRRLSFEAQSLSMEKLEVPSNQQQGSESAEQARIDPNDNDRATDPKPEKAEPNQQEPTSEPLDLVANEVGSTSNTDDVIVTPQVNAVRVLFKDQQDKEQALPQQNQLIGHQQQDLADGTLPQQTTIIGGDRIVRPVNRVVPQLQATIVSANRQLIERQIEAIQEADSRRWNFDFRTCRPLDLTDHRYIHLSVDSRNINRNYFAMNNDDNNNNDNNNTDINCRPLSDRNSNIASRLTSNHQRWWSTRATRGTHPNRGDHNKPEEE